MIEYIICDDSKARVEDIEKCIKSVMKNLGVNIEMHHFSGYGSGFKKLAQERKAFKVYFLDIETKKGSGIDAARLIREGYGDWNSIIIFESAHVEEKYTVQSSRLYIFDFLDKNDNFDSMLDEDLKRIYRIYLKSSKTMPAIDKDKIEKVEIRDILYIEKNLASKSCTLHTLYGNKITKEGINNCMKYLTDDFIMTSRSAIVNLKKIREYNYKTNTITFINNTEMTNISRDYRKKLKNYVRNVN